MKANTGWRKIDPHDHHNTTAQFFFFFFFFLARRMEDNAEKQKSSIKKQNEDFVQTCIQNIYTINKLFTGKEIYRYEKMKFRPEPSPDRNKIQNFALDPGWTAQV